jgi:hypothetical protein
LKFNGAKWRVNDQLSDVDMVDVLFATLQQAEPKRPFSGGEQDSVNETLTKQGVIVRLFEGEILQKEFIAGGNAAKTQAYFKNVETDEWYVMSIPGYRVYPCSVTNLGSAYPFRLSNVKWFCWLPENKARWVCQARKSSMTLSGVP